MKTLTVVIDGNYELKPDPIRDSWYATGCPDEFDPTPGLNLWWRLRWNLRLLRARYK